MNFFTKEVKIALVAIIGIIILFFGMNFLKGLNMFSSSNTYYIAFDDITGLSPSNPIYADGFKVGVVKGVTYDYENNKSIKVEIGLDKNMRLPKGSSACIVSDLLGNVRVDLILDKEVNEMLAPGSTIPGGIDAGAMGKVSAMVPVVVKMLPKIDSILSSVNTLLADPALAHSVHNVEHITSDLTKSTLQLSQLISTLNRQVPGMMTKANSVLENTDRLTGNLASIDVSETMGQVNETLAQLQEITHKLNSKEGTVGLLMSDPGLYNNLNQTLRDADSLLVNLKQHPKRYVHFSIFGRKDK